jgi:16S rRNA (guanine527-N7)-methyltransferase
MFHVKHFDRSLVEDILNQGLSELATSLSPAQTGQLLAYFELLLKRNETLNLISSKQDLTTKVAVHLIDSLSALLFDWPPQLRVMDFGSGGGLPALPLSIIYPGWHYTLMEATGKKAAFLTEVVQELALPRVRVVNKFLEAGRNNENEFYDLITARAVSALGKLAAVAGPRLKAGAFFLAFKGPRGLTELEAAAKDLERNKMAKERHLTLRLPLVGAERILILLRRI